MTDRPRIRLFIYHQHQRSYCRAEQQKDGILEEVEMKRVVITLISLLIITPSQAEEKTTGPVESTQLKIQEERLKHIEEQASIERQQIEARYKRQLSELRQLAERKVKQLKPDNRALWTEFIKMHEQTPLFDTYFKKNDQILATTLMFIRSIETFDLRAALADSYFLSAAADLLLDQNFRKRLADLADGSAYNPQSLLVRKEARKLLYVVDEFQSKLAALQVRRDAKLTAVEQREQHLRADILRVIQEIKAAPGRVNEGIVSAIAYRPNSPVCMIDGIDKILQEGDSIGNIEVVKIYPDQVEFAKGSQKWTQQVGKPANDAWK